MIRSRLTAKGEPYPQVNQTARSLAKLGHEVVLFGWDRTAGCRYSSRTDWGWIERYPVTVPIDRTFGRDGFIGRLPGFYWWIRKRVYFFYKKHGYKDIIFHAHDLDTLPLGILLSKALDKPLIYEAHENYGGMIYNVVGPDLSNYVQRLEMYLLRFCDGLIGSGPPVYAWLMSLLSQGYPASRVPFLGTFKITKKYLTEKIPPHPSWDSVIAAFDAPERLLCNDNITMISNAKDLDDYEGDYETPELFSKLEGFNFLYVGVFIGENLKHLPQIITVMKRISGVNLIIAGYGSRSGVIEKMADENKNIHFIGALVPDDIPKWTRSVDATLRLEDVDNLNSIYSTANIFFSSLAAGKPQLCNDNIISGHIVKTKETGFAIPFGDWLVFDKTIRYMRDNPDEVKRRGSNGKKLAVDKHNWAINEKRLHALYNRVTNP
jgi:glycosyltransferase involved in cell wall biosynthesis